MLHRHVKSLSDASAKNLHFQAPEIDHGTYVHMELKPRSCRAVYRVELFDHRSGHLLVGNGHSGGTSMMNVNGYRSMVLDDQFGSGRKWGYAYRV